MKKSRYTQEMLEEAVKSSVSWAEVCRKLGVKPATGSQTYIKKRAEIHRIDFSHFLGQAWSKGKTFFHKQRPLEEYLVIDGPFISTDALKKRLIRLGIKEAKCEICQLSLWLGEPIPIEMHHINGDRSDNRLSNLQILCRNCHGLTSNHSGKNLREVAKRQTRCA